MKTKVIFISLLIIIGMKAFGQRPALVLTFTAVNNAAYIQLDSIKVMNRTQGGETMIYWPDTSLSAEINEGDLLLYVGYATFSTEGVEQVDNEVSSFELHQNFPNPMADHSEILLHVPLKGKVHLMITDLQGKVVLCTDRQLDGGYHSFTFYPGGGNLYFLTAYWNGLSRSIKMISTWQQDGKTCSLDYVGSHSGEPILKVSLQADDFLVKESGILDSPVESQSYTFRFATNIPCPGAPTVEYEEQVYNTIQVFSQCWLKENLNVGTMIQGNEEMTENGIIEKHCYNNEPSSCAKYGGLYQWDEMMQYTTQPGTQGICPPGWHLPTDEEWKVLEGAVDSPYGIGDDIWDDSELRGYDAVTNLKTTSGWNENGNGTDLFGFSGLPGGDRYYGGIFSSIRDYGYWWTSTERGIYRAWYRCFIYYDPGVIRDYYYKEIGFSARCLRDD